MAIIKHIQLSVSSLVLALALPGLAYAKNPPDVMKAYTAYTVSMEKGDFKNAIKHAKTAWEKAEAEMGDHVMTGDLAYNYGYVEKDRGDKTKSIEAFKRSVELAHLKPTDAASYRLEREVELVSSMDGVSKDKKMRNRIKDAVKFAKANGLESTVYVGELYVHDTNACARRHHIMMKERTRQLGERVSKQSVEDSVVDGTRKCAKIAEKAVNIFESNPSETRPAYAAIAYKYVGSSFEMSKNYISAALTYQNARNSIEDVYGRENPLVAEMIGRWINARNYLERKNQLEHAEAQGLCKCWPYSNDRPQVKITKWADYDFPAKALNRSSGYAIVRMDVSDAGVPENVRILNSWPEDIYDKSSLKAARKLEFASKTGDEPEGYRKNVMVPYSYFLRSGLDPL